MPKIAGQRQGFASVTRGNVAGSHTPGNNTTETGLFEPPHGGIKIRTFLTKNNSLHVWMAATQHLGTKGLRAFCQTL
jgi:hypothetical protein